MIAIDTALQAAENKVPASQIEAINKNIFNHFNNEPFVHIAELVPMLPLYTAMEGNIFRDFLVIGFSVIAEENDLNLFTMIAELFHN